MPATSKHHLPSGSACAQIAGALRAWQKLPAGLQSSASKIRYDATAWLYACPPALNAALQPCCHLRPPFTATKLPSGTLHFLNSPQTPSRPRSLPSQHRHPPPHSQPQHAGWASSPCHTAGFHNITFSTPPTTTTLTPPACRVGLIPLLTRNKPYITHRAPRPLSAAKRCLAQLDLDSDTDSDAPPPSPRCRRRRLFPVSFGQLHPASPRPAKCPGVLSSLCTATGPDLGIGRRSGARCCTMRRSLQEPGSWFQGWLRHAVLPHFCRLLSNSQLQPASPRPAKCPGVLTRA